MTETDPASETSYILNIPKTLENAQHIIYIYSKIMLMFFATRFVTHKLARIYLNHISCITQKVMTCKLYN
jgi:hypothetical protein